MSTSTHHLSAPTPHSLRPCLKSAPTTRAPTRASSPTHSSLSLSPIPRVRFPPPQALSSIHPTHGKAEYDRSPIAPPSPSERACALPARGCPGRNYDLYAIDRISCPPSGGMMMTGSSPAAYPTSPSTSKALESTPGLTFSSSCSSSSEESDSSPAMADPAPSPSSPASFLELQFLPHAPSGKRRSASPSDSTITIKERESGRERERRPRLRPQLQQTQSCWASWSADDEGGCLGGF